MLTAHPRYPRTRLFPAPVPHRRQPLSPPPLGLVIQYRAFGSVSGGQKELPPCELLRSEVIPRKQLPGLSLCVSPAVQPPPPLCPLVRSAWKGRPRNHRVHTRHTNGQMTRERSGISSGEPPTPQRSPGTLPTQWVGSDPWDSAFVEVSVQVSVTH